MTAANHDARGDPAVLIHLIYTETGLLLSRKPYASWRELQDAFPDYTTALGPWPAPELVDYLVAEHPGLVPAAAAQVAAFLASAEETRALTP